MRLNAVVTQFKPNGWGNCLPNGWNQRVLFHISDLSGSTRLPNNGDQIVIDLPEEGRRARKWWYVEATKTQKIDDEFTVGGVVFRLQIYASTDGSPMFRLWADRPFSSEEGLNEALGDFDLQEDIPEDFEETDSAFKEPDSDWTDEQWERWQGYTENHPVELLNDEIPDTFRECLGGYSVTETICVAQPDSGGDHQGWHRVYLRLYEF